MQAIRSGPVELVLKGRRPLRRGRADPGADVREQERAGSRAVGAPELIAVDPIGGAEVEDAVELDREPSRRRLEQSHHLRQPEGRLDSHGILDVRHHGRRLRPGDARQSRQQSQNSQRKRSCPHVRVPPEPPSGGVKLLDRDPVFGSLFVLLQCHSSISSLKGARRGCSRPAPTGRQPGAWWQVRGSGWDGQGSDTSPEGGRLLAHF